MYFLSSELQFFNLGINNSFPLRSSSGVNEGFVISLLTRLAFGIGLLTVNSWQSL